ncbi:MAG: twitching motility protein PilT [Acidimicrobiaceae bacterium]|jgi:twitching motility protein PilT|nr:twitching motility protein PilT [Acidimicrobiaceae bacterium]MDQ1445584.1 twitching motility protein PilT [Acidimicrobiaceae bacterium]
MQAASRRLGEFLVERKVLSRDTLEQLLDREATEGVPLSKLLLAEGLVGEKDLVAAVAHQVGMDFVDFDVRNVNPTLDRLIPAALAHKHQAVAVDIEGSDLLVAMLDPSNPDAKSELEQATSWSIKAALATRGDLRKVVNQMYGPPASEEDGDLEITVADESSQSEAPNMLGAEGMRGELHVNDLLERVVDLGGSDLHLTVGLHPSVRIHGEIKPLTEFPMMNGSEIRRMIYAILTQKQRERFENELELDTSHSVPGVGRFRVNVFLQRDSVGSVMRVIPFEIVPMDRLGLPPSVNQFADLPRGLVLVTGPTGSGKSTTLASLIDIINARKPCHIMTVEDPIEFLHHHKMAVINQREVGEDTYSFSNALKHVLRQDPDVILVGEMRDLETISTALTAAETGHLVFATLHTQDAPQSVDRVIDVFPAHQQQQVRVQLAASLQGIVTQQLIPTMNARGRAVASEVLVATPAVRNLIREGKTHQIYSAMQAGGRYGMQTMDMSLADLVRRGAISLEMAIERCANEDDLRRLIGGAR